MSRTVDKGVCVNKDDDDFRNQGYQNSDNLDKSAKKDAQIQGYLG